MTNILQGRDYYKPFRYPELFELFVSHEKKHWIPEELKLDDDIRHWDEKLGDPERRLLTELFRFFVAADHDVLHGYGTLINAFQNTPEAAMVLSSIAARECYDDQTEILTPEGFVLFKDLTQGQKVAQYNKDTGEISFVVPSKYHVSDYIGNMHLYESKKTSLCVTPNHRLALINPHTRTFKIDKSENGVWGRNYLYPSTGLGIGSDNILTDLERLLIALQADGTIRATCDSHSNSKATCDFNVKKPEKVNRIITLLSRNGLNCNPRYQDDGSVKFTFTLPSSVDLFNIKNLGFLVIESMSSVKAKSVIEELRNWDCGKNGESSFVYYSTNLEAVNKVQQIATLAGVTSTLGINHEACVKQVLNNPNPSQTKTCYRVGLSFNSPFRCYPNRQEVPYEGKVYCVTVPDGLVVVRRNGRMAVSGNSVHLHGYSLLIDSLGMPEAIYKDFLEYKEMSDKHNYVHKAFSDLEEAWQNYSHGNHKFDYEDYLVALTKVICITGCFIEGLQLFSSFAVLKNFEHSYKAMPGMNDVVDWSIKDESDHIDTCAALFKILCEEFSAELNVEEIKNEISKICVDMVTLEDRFVDLMFNAADNQIKGLSKEEVKQFVRALANGRLQQFGMNPIYFDDNGKSIDNPLTWLDFLIYGKGHTNFFERRATEYGKGIQGELKDDDFNF